MESDRIIEALYGAALSGWAVVSGPGGCGITAILRGLVTRAVSAGPDASPVVLCEQPTDYSIVDLQSIARDFREPPFFVLDGVNFACATLLHTLPPELHGVVGMTTTSPVSAWKWLSPQQRGARIQVLFMRWNGGPTRHCHLFTGPAAEAVDLGTLDATEAVRLLETPLPARGIVQVKTSCSIHGFRRLEYRARPGECTLDGLPNSPDAAARPPASAAGP